MATKKVKAPAGFHWMKKGTGSPKLMKHTCKFVPHHVMYGSIRMLDRHNRRNEIEIQQQ